MQAVTPEKGRPSFKPSLQSGALDSVWHWGGAPGQCWALRCVWVRCARLDTDLVAVGLRGQLLVQRSHVGCQSLESIPHFVLLSSRNRCISQGELVLRKGQRFCFPMRGARYLLRAIPLQPEFAWHFTPGVLAAVEVHTPRAPKGEGSTTFFRVLALARTGATVGRMKNQRLTQKQV